MSALPTITGITAEEYLERERAAEYKSEYYKGRMLAMAGTSYRHGLVVAKMGALLSLSLRGTSCRAIPGDLRVRVSPEGLYTYPDIVVVCGSPVFADDEKDTLLNPTLVIEVLSNSTEAHDRGFKATQYRRIESLREHVLVSQYEAHIEIYRRRSGEWLLSEHQGLDDTCQFESVDRAFSMAEIYEDITFDE